jgi:hypothetical protein
VFAQILGISSSPARFNLHIAAVGPPELLQLVQNYGDCIFAQRIVSGKTEQYANAPYTLNLLRMC